MFEIQEGSFYLKLFKTIRFFKKEVQLNAN